MRLTHQFASPRVRLPRRGILLACGGIVVGWPLAGFAEVTYSLTDLDPSGNAVPEPASLGLLAFGATALLRRRRR